MWHKIKRGWGWGWGRGQGRGQGIRYKGKGVTHCMQGKGQRANLSNVTSLSLSSPARLSFLSLFSFCPPLPVACRPPLSDADKMVLPWHGKADEDQMILMIDTLHWGWMMIDSIR